MAVSNEMKQIAKYLASTFGGKSSVFTYGDDNNKSKIAILHSENTPQTGEISYGTIGLCDYDIDLEVDEKPLRVEIVGACISEFKEFGNIISTCAFNIINSGYECYPGIIYPNVVKMYYEDLEMQHIMLVDPFLWDDKLDTLTFDDKIVEWLQAIPISDFEYAYAKEHGSDALGDLLEKANIDILDLERESII